MADKRENIDVTVELHDELSRPARRAEDSVDDLGDEVKELAADAAVATTQTNRLERALRALKQAAGSSTKELDKNSAAAKRLAANQKAANERAEKAEKLMGKLGKVMKMLKFPAIAAAITLAATALSSLGAAAFAAIAGLSPLVGILGAIPALLLGVGTAVAAVKLGFKGVGEALKVVNDGTKGTAEQAAALRKLTPAGREFVGVLKDMSGWTKSVGRSVQTAMLPGFTDALVGLRPVLPVVREGLKGVGAEMGDLASSVASVVRGNQLERIFNRSERLISKGLTPALTAFTGIFLNFAVAGGPLAERFATWLGLAAERLAQLVDQGRKSGGLTDFLNRAGDLAAEVGAVIGDASVALYNMGRESGVLTTMFGHGIRDLTARWRAWTESVEGQNAIRQWFEDARPLMAELGDTVAILARSFMNLASNGNLTALVNQINTQLLPAISDFAEGAASNLGPALVGLATAFVKFQAALSWSPLATVLMGIATAGNAVLDVFGMLPGPIKTLIATILVLRTASKLAGAAMALLPRQAGQQAGMFGQMRAGAQLYSEGLRGIPRAVGAAKGAMVGLKSAGSGLMGAMGGPWGLALAGATLAIGAWASKQAEAKARAQELTDTLDAQTGALTADSDAAIARMLVDEGWDNTKLEKYGLTMGEVITAMHGGEDAVKALGKTARDEAGNVDLAWGGMDQLFAGSVSLNGGAQLESDLLDVADAAKQAGINQDTYNDAAAAAAPPIKTATELLREKVEADRRAAAGSDGSARAARRHGDAVDYTIRKVKELRNLQMEAIGAEVSYQQAKDDTAKALREGARTLDINSQAGRDNVTAISDLISAAAGLKNEAKRQAALKEATKQIRDWGRESGISQERINKLIDRMIRTKEVATDLNGTSVDVTVTANTDAAYAEIAAFNARARSILAANGASQATMDASLGGPARERREGGPIEAGASYIVGEVGPELLVTASGVDVIGRHGREQRRFAESGYVLPNETYRAMAEADAPAALPRVAAPAAVGRSAGAHGDAPTGEVPEVHFHVPGQQTNLTEDDFRRIALEAWRKVEREKKERR